MTPKNRRQQHNKQKARLRSSDYQQTNYTRAQTLEVLDKI
jgi:hypothetical protein